MPLHALRLYNRKLVLDQYNPRAYQAAFELGTES